MILDQCFPSCSGTGCDRARAVIHFGGFLCFVKGPILKKVRYLFCYKAFLGGLYCRKGQHEITDIKKMLKHSDKHPKQKDEHDN